MNIKLAILASSSHLLNSTVSNNESSFLPLIAINVLSTFLLSKTIELYVTSKK